MTVRRFQSKIMVSFCLMMVVGGAVMTLVVARNLKRSLMLSAEQNGLALARTVSHQVAQPLAHGDRLEVVQLLAHAKAGNPDVAYLFITGEDGAVGDHTFSITGFPESLRPVARRASPTTLGRVTSGAKKDLPAPIQGGSQGTVHVGLSLASAESTTRNVVRSVFLTTALAIAAGMVGVFLLSSFIARPVGQLRAAMREIGRGNLAVRAVATTRDEIGDLASDFNAMAARLQGAVTGLAAERRQLDELLNSISDGVVLVDTGLRVVTTNRGFGTRLPDNVRATSGSTYRDVVRATGLAAPANSDWPAERAFQSCHGESEILRRAIPNGERFEEIYAHPLRTLEGSVTAVVEVWRDITDRRALEANLEQSERLAAIGMLASAVAHEVGNPLASIAIAVESLLRRLGEPGGPQDTEIREYLQVVRKQVFRCHGVTERLLNFARLPSRKLTAVDAATTAHDVLALVAPQANAQGVEIRTALTNPVPVLAEDLLLDQVLLNLIANALQAMPKGGVLRVEVSASADSAVIIVADTGPGIPDDVRQHLFQPFHRAREGASTGLGLFLSHTLVERCGGTLTLGAEAGQGAVFIVRLRRAPDGAALVAALQAHGQSGA